jgi:chromosome segregation ATPase
MDFEHIIKRLDWLDQEQRSAKQVLSHLQESAASLESAVNAESGQIKSLAKAVTEAQTAAKRIDQFDTFLANHRKEFNLALEKLEARIQQRERETAERTKAELDSVRQALSSIHPATDPDIVRKFKERSDENQRIMLSLNEIRQRMEDVARSSQDAAHGLKAAEEVRSRDLKRLSDMQAEVASLRKRVDEAREQNVLHGDTVRNIEKRIGELQLGENSRSQAQAAFLEGVTRSQAEREKGWREWSDRYGQLAKHAEALEGQVGTIDETLRAARRAQETYQELNTKLERRINEITELQRLGEDRLRQEWIAFKTDDQKRWTGHALASEEALRDARRTLEKLEPRLAALEDAAHVLQDQMHQTAEASEQQLGDLMNVLHEWMSSYERIMGRSKKTAKKPA